MQTGAQLTEEAHSQIYEPPVARGQFVPIVSQSTTARGPWKGIEPEASIVNAFPFSPLPDWRTEKEEKGRPPCSGQQLDAGRGRGTPRLINGEKGL